jgi:hypothetical protein
MPWSTSVTSGLVASRGATPRLTSVWITPANAIAAALSGVSCVGCSTEGGTTKYTFIDAQ